MRVVYANAGGVCAGREEEEEGSDYEGMCMHVGAWNPKARASEAHTCTPRSARFSVASPQSTFAPVAMQLFYYLFHPNRSHSHEW
jgi:hypothetical protein